MGITVTGAVFATLGPTLARSGLRGAVAGVLRSLASLAQAGAVAPALGVIDASRGLRWNVYQSVASTLQLHEEARFEAGASRPEAVAERASVLRATNHALAAMLALLAIVRHRLVFDLAAFAGPPARFRALGAAIAETFERLAERLEDRCSGTLPDLRPLLSDTEEAVATEASEAVGVVHLRARVALYRTLIDTVGPLVQDVLALAPPSPAFPVSAETLVAAQRPGADA
jgi:hypothetical protein